MTASHLCTLPAGSSAESSVLGHKTINLAARNLRNYSKSAQRFVSPKSRICEGEPKRRLRTARQSLGPANSLPCASADGHAQSLCRYEASICVSVCTVPHHSWPRFHCAGAAMQAQRRESAAVTPHETAFQTFKVTRAYPERSHVFLFRKS